MRRFGLLCLAVLFALACDDSGEKASCIEGAYEQCSCASGASGTRLCSNGKLGDCVCGSVEQQGDACDGVRCNAYEQCVDGSCELRPGRCDSDGDCGEGQACDVAAHTCGAAGASCDALACASHQECVEQAGTAACRAREGFCDGSGDCPSPAASRCDAATHQCVDACSGISCASYEQCAEGACVLADGRCLGDGDCAGVSGKPKCSAEKWCVSNTAADLCEGVTCEEYASCREGQCVLNAGRCASAEDCASQAALTACDTASHTCVDPCALANCDASYQRCVGGACELAPGKCASDGDCSGSAPKCDAASHTCVARCAGVSCASYEQCAEASGTCALREGMCADARDCPAEKGHCDATHTCVQEDQCSWRNCGDGATCSNLGGAAVCNCPFATTWGGSACRPLSDAEKVNWCSIAWVEGWDSSWESSGKTSPIVTDFAVGADLTVYAQVYVENPAGGSITGKDKEAPSNVRAELLYTEEAVTLPLEPHRFTRVEAQLNRDFSCSGIACNNHEYMARLPSDRPASLRFVFRYSRDEGASWNYCGPLEQDKTLVQSSSADQLGTANIADVK